MADEEEYAVHSKGKLKLKTDSEKSKKKKRKRDKEKIEKNVTTSEISRETIQITESTTGSRYTKAELAFKKMQDKMQHKRVMEKASTTHKQQVEKFNEKLDQLTEHFDIPKVSWTK